MPIVLDLMLAITCCSFLGHFTQFFLSRRSGKLDGNVPERRPHWPIPKSRALTRREVNIRLCLLALCVFGYVWLVKSVGTLPPACANPTYEADPLQHALCTLAGEQIQNAM
jgi:hypothetical protein